MAALRSRRRPLPSRGLGLLLALALSCAGQGTDDDCLECHATDRPVVDRAVLKGSAHAAVRCVECHRDAEVLPHDERLEKVSCARCHADEAKTYLSSDHGRIATAGASEAASCGACHGVPHGVPAAGAAFRRAVPTACGRCHAKTAAVYEGSIHGQAHARGIKDSPVCTDCHQSHALQFPTDPASSVSAGAVTGTCARCHASERIALKFGLPVDRLESYLESYHGLAYRRNDATVANCASCHGYHDVLPATDPRSSVHARNLPRTCGRCHPGAGAQLTGTSIHRPPGQKHWTVGLATTIYLFLIPVTVGFMLLHNGLDLVRKALSPRQVEAAGNGLKLTAHERVQHAVLAVSFVVLALSGFALKYPDSAWTRWFSSASEDSRRDVHRAAAIVFCLLGVHHLLYLALSRRGRAVLSGMWPRGQDVRALGQHFAHALGWRRDPPEQRGEWAYPEKVEYWALLWGSTVMVVTGGVLVFHGFAMRHLPAWTSDLATVVHFYEAVLACLAILLWHGYMVVFDPDVYPMNRAWLTGRVRRR